VIPDARAALGTVVKTISAAVPLCPTCPKGENALEIESRSTEPEAAESEETVEASSTPVEAATAVAVAESEPDPIQAEQELAETKQQVEQAITPEAIASNPEQATEAAKVKERIVLAKEHVKAREVEQTGNVVREIERDADGEARRIIEEAERKAAQITGSQQSTSSYSFTSVPNGAARTGPQVFDSAPKTALAKEGWTATLEQLRKDGLTSMAGTRAANRCAEGGPCPSSRSPHEYLDSHHHIRTE
jgi:hypothetical protein